MSKLDAALQMGSSRAKIAFEAELPEDLRPLLVDDAGEGRLWRAIGALALWTRAGYLPPAAVPATAISSTDTQDDALQACPPRAEAMLAHLLRDSHPPLRGEWLRLAALHHCRIPARLLPRMLEAGSSQQALRPAIVTVLGARGHWLARQHAQWTWASSTPGNDDSDIAAQWEAGTLAQRVLALRQLRARDPAAALQCLQVSWSQESPEDRALLLPCLSVSLSLADEAFLEAALDDRRKEVRLQAQQLLRTLPGCALQQRMLERLAPLLHLQRRKLFPDSLDVALPAASDKSMLRDGIGAQGWPQLGEKAGWLADMLASLSPLHWSALFDKSPAQCLKLALSNEFHGALVLGWSSALLRQMHAGTTTPAAAAALGDWLQALALLWLATDGVRVHYARDFFSAYGALPAADVHSRLAQLVDACGPTWGDPQLPLLGVLADAARASPAPWPATLSLAVMQRLRAGLSTFSVPAWHFKPTLEAFAQVLDPAAMAACEAGWPTGSPAWASWQAPVDDMFSVIRFRHALSLSFQEQI